VRRGGDSKREERGEVEEVDEGVQKKMDSVFSYLVGPPPPASKRKKASNMRTNKRLSLALSLLLDRLPVHHRVDVDVSHRNCWVSRRSGPSATRNSTAQSIALARRGATPAKKGKRH